MLIIILLKGSRQWDELAPFRSILTVINNVPQDYTVENFRDKILDLLVNQHEDLYHQLKGQLRKTSQSYQKLVIDLSKGKLMRSGIDFYFTAARIFLGKPFVLVKAWEVKKPEKGTTSPKYECEKQYLLPTDAFLNPSKIKLTFAFSGIDFYCPFLPAVITNLYCECVPIMRDIEMAYEDVCDIEEKLPPQKSINGGIHSMKLHLQAAVEIMQTTRFTCSSSNPDIMQQPGPTFDPLAAGTITRKRKKCDIFNVHGRPYKQTKKGQLPTVSLSEHISEMNAAGMPGPETGTAVADTASAPMDTGTPLEGDGMQQPPVNPVTSSGQEMANVDEEEDSDEYVLVRQPETNPHLTQCICGQEFTDREQLRNHKGHKHSNHNYVCCGKVRYKDGSVGLCEKEFGSTGSMWRHYHSIHLGLWLYYCPVENCKCESHDWGPYGADSEDAVKKHMVSVHGLKSDLTCTHQGCNYVGASKSHLRDHMDRHSAKSVKLFHYEICGKGYRSKGGMRNHVKQEHPDEEGDTSGYFFCEKCDKKFATLSGRNGHHYNVHVKKQKEKEKGDKGKEKPKKPGKKHKKKK